MSPLEQRLSDGLQSLADGAPDVHGDLERVKTIGRRRRILGRAGVTASAAILVFVAVGSVALLRGEQVTPVAAPTDVATSVAPAALAPQLRTVLVTVSGVSGYANQELAGVLYAGGELTDLDREALGGFWSVITDDDFTTTEVARQPGDAGIGRFPYVSDTALTLEPGTYTLVLWVDYGLSPTSRWVPVNSDGAGLFGCQTVFDVAGDAQTDVTVTANLHPDGWNVDCTTGVAIPGTDAAAAVAPSMDAWEADPLELSMPPATGVGAGQTVGVSLSGVSGRRGDEFAAVLYEGGDLSNLDREALGGFWTVIASDDQSLTEVVREPGEFGVGRFPYVSDAALTVEPGTYTLVLWVDETLGPVSRWVPINSFVPGDPLTEGQDLYGCHVVFDVSDDLQTDVVVPANLHHNGWNVDCTTGVAIPGTDAAAAVAPPVDTWELDLAELSMPPAIGVGDDRTVLVTVSGVSGYANQELAGVLYAGGELTDLDREALGGFWSVITDDDFTTTEVARQPGDAGIGRFPYVSDTALTLEPGTYTLVLWVDYGLSPTSRWVPVNSDGAGLFGCQTVFDVAGDAQTDVTVTANLHPDGWNVDCTTGVAIPGTDAAAAVAPSM